MPSNVSAHPERQHNLGGLRLLHNVAAAFSSSIFSDTKEFISNCERSPSRNLVTLFLIIFTFSIYLRSFDLTI